MPLRATVYDSPLDFDAGAIGRARYMNPHQRAQLYVVPLSRRDDAAGPSDAWAELDALFRASAATDAAARAAKEKETRDYMKSWASAFDMVLPGAGAALLWAYDATVAIGKAVYGESKWNTEEAKNAVKNALTGLLRWMVDPPRYDGELYAGALGYADALKFLLEQIDALSPAERAQLQKIADARIYLATSKNPTYIDMLGMPGFVPSPAANAVPHTAYMLGTVAALMHAAPVATVQKATVDHWVAQRAYGTTEKAPDGGTWTRVGWQMRRYLENYAFADALASKLGKPTPVIMLALPGGVAPKPVSGSGGGGLPLFGKTLGTGTPPGGSPDVPEPPTSKGKKTTTPGETMGTFVLIAAIGAALLLMSKGKV